VKERIQFLLLVLQGAGATPGGSRGDGLTLGQFCSVLSRHKVSVNSQALSNWLRQPLKMGLLERLGSAGPPFFPGPGYRFRLSTRGAAWLAATLNLVIPEGESETDEPEAEGEAEAGESAIDDITREASKPESEPGADMVKDSLPKKKDGGVISGATLLLLGTLAGLAYYSPPVRQFLADWWSRNFPEKSGPGEIPPETPSGLTV